MPALQAPGVRYQRLDARAPAITAIRTDVAGFVGVAERGPLHTPVPVQSWRQFEARFGGFTAAGFLAYAVRAFFENGGRRCWIVRVASADPLGGAAAAETRARLYPPPAPPDATGEIAWRLRASSPGSWGDTLAVSLRETHTAQTRSDPARSVPEATAVLGIDGFTRYTLVRVSQDGAAPRFRVVSDVDPVDGRLLWLHPDPEARTRYDARLDGVDPGRPLLIESVEYTLLVWEAGRFLRAYGGLSLVPEHPRYGPRVLAEPAIPHPAEIGAAIPPPEPVVIEELRPLPLAGVAPLDARDETPRYLSGGSDGLTLLRPRDFAGDPADPAAAQRGFRALDPVDEVTAVALPDLHVRPVPVPPKSPLPPCEPDPCLPELLPPPVAAPPSIRREDPPVFPFEQVARIQMELVEHCELRADRIALLDPPADAALDPQEGSAIVRAWRQRFASSYAAVYWPWLRVVDPLRPGRLRDVPPSGHVAGLFARTDFAEGVHRAPANLALEWLQDLTLPADEALHAELNDLGINLVLALPGRGIRVMGARTLGTDGPRRFVSVRRLLIMIRKAILRSTQWAVFEPNDYLTRTKLRLALGNFLLALWQRGGLAGATPDEAFRVKCDEENNPPHERDNGRLLAEAAIAPTHPLEFIIVRVGRSENEFEIAEASMTRRGP